MRTPTVLPLDTGTEDPRKAFQERHAVALVPIVVEVSPPKAGDDPLTHVAVRCAWLAGRIYDFIHAGEDS